MDFEKMLKGTGDYFRDKQEKEDNFYEKTMSRHRNSTRDELIEARKKCSSLGEKKALDELLGL